MGKPGPLRLCRDDTGGQAEEQLWSLSIPASQLWYTVGSRGSVMAVAEA